VNLLKIGVITSAYPEFEDDPHGIFVHRLMKGISKHGHEIHVLAPFASGKTKYNLEGINVEKFNYFYPKRFQRLAGRSGMIDNVKEGTLVKIQVLSFLFFNVVNSLKFKDMDVIHVQWPIPNGLGALFLKKLYGIPYINTVHGEEVYLSKRYHTFFALKWLVNNSIKTITNSSATRGSCLEAGMEKENFEVIPFGVDTNFYRPLDISKDENIFQILSVGYLIERKGFEYLIRAIKEVLKEHNDVLLTLVGSGPLEKKLKDLLKDLELENNFKIIKNVSDDELLCLYNLSDLFVLPSVVDSEGNTEGLGVVLLEAMACGLPVIGSNVGGIIDIIKDKETGLLIPEKNDLELSKAILLLMRDEKLRKKIAVAGFNRINERFSMEHVTMSYLTVYKELLSHNKKKYNY
jgi:glycosyltransferase involved in cell wall biosynthesis